ncbi:hypothetical protein ANO11243_000710 [Dothideomycetidae sp. 11243]|nr:hypothetical protein ANO11243_000710 [fungal sp. No.11243]
MAERTPSEVHEEYGEWLRTQLAAMPEGSFAPYHEEESDDSEEEATSDEEDIDKHASTQPVTAAGMTCSISGQGNRILTELPGGSISSASEAEYFADGEDNDEKLIEEEETGLTSAGNNDTDDDDDDEWLMMASASEIGARLIAAATGPARRVHPDDHVQPRAGRIMTADKSSRSVGDGEDSEYEMVDLKTLSSPNGGKACPSMHGGVMSPTNSPLPVSPVDRADKRSVEFSWKGRCREMHVITWRLNCGRVDQAFSGTGFCSSITTSGSPPSSTPAATKIIIDNSPGFSAVHTTPSILSHNLLGTKRAFACKWNERPPTPPPSFDHLHRSFAPTRPDLLIENKLGLQHGQKASKN